MLYKNNPFAPSDADPIKGLVKGYFAHFGSKDSDGDIIQVKAFDKTVRENGPKGTNRIKHYLNHDDERPLGAMKELSPDATGLAYVSQLLKFGDRFLPDAELVLAGIESGYSLEHSFGYGIPKGKQEKTADGNLLHEIIMFEGSTLTKYAANFRTPITGLKSFKDPLEAMEALEKMLRTGNWQDETYELMQSKYDEIGLLIKGTTEPPKGTQPDLDGFESRIKSMFSFN